MYETHGEAGRLAPRNDEDGWFMRKTLIFLMATFTTGHAFSAERWTPDQNTCNQQENTLAIVDCYEGRVDIWDHRLNAVYGQLMAEFKKTASDRVAPLKAAQLAWIKYRDANCAFYYSEDGTIKQIDTITCKLQMTQDRAIELQSALPQ